MVRIKSILDTVEQMMQERFPALKAYRNLVRKNFSRPSFIVSAGKQTMEDATFRAVDRTARVVVALFVPVDDYHDSNMDDLADLLTAAMELFSCRAVAVGDRYLDVENVVGETDLDYAELSFTLSWQDDRDVTPVESALLEDIDITVGVNGGTLETEG